MRMLGFGARVADSAIRVTVICNETRTERRQRKAKNDIFSQLRHKAYHRESLLATKKENKIKREKRKGKETLTRTHCGVWFVRPFVAKEVNVAFFEFSVWACGTSIFGEWQTLGYFWKSKTLRALWSCQVTPPFLGVESETSSMPSPTL